MREERGGEGRSEGERVSACGREGRRNGKESWYVWELL